SNQISVGHVGAVCLGVCVNRSDSKYEYQIRRGLGLKLAHHTLNAFIYALFCNLMYTHTHTHTHTPTHHRLIFASPKVSVLSSCAGNGVLSAGAGGVVF